MNYFFDYITLWMWDQLIHIPVDSKKQLDVLLESKLDDFQLF